MESNAQVEPPAVQPPAVQPTGRPNARLAKTVKDMVWSMVVVLALVGVILAIAWRPSPDPVRTVDPQSAVSVAQAQADFPLLAPVGLPSDWRATSARWESTEASLNEPVLHIGYVTPSGGYAQLTEYAVKSGSAASDAIDTALFREQVGATNIADDESIGNVDWQAGATKDDKVLVTADSGRLVAISGTATWDELRVLATALRPIN